MEGFALNNIQNCYVGSTPATAIYLGSNKIWPTTPHDYSQDYLTIISLSDNNTFGWKTYGGSSTHDKIISISTDNGSTWISKTDSTTGDGSVNDTSSGTILTTLNTGDKMLIKGTNTRYAEGTNGWTTFTSTGNFYVEGNIMSLIYNDNFISETNLTQTYTFAGLFYKCINLINAENLILPATTLMLCCYHYMFSGCTNLITTPELPATTLVNNCYSHMFSGCKSLTTSPKLPATILAYECYCNMFGGCTNLITAPELPATTLAGYCYWQMFYNCKSLTTAPELPATILTQSCYSDMFYYCTNLNYIKMLATDISAIGCLANWTRGVSSTGTFVKNAAMTTLPTGTSGVPAGWTLQDA